MFMDRVEKLSLKSVISIAMNILWRILCKTNNSTRVRLRDIYAIIYRQMYYLLHLHNLEGLNKIMHYCDLQEVIWVT